MNEPPLPDRAHIQAALAALMTPGEVYEVRIPNSRDGRLGVVSGYFDTPAALVEATGTITGLQAEAVYLTLNPVTPSLLARSANRLKARAKDVTTDTWILQRRHLLLDLDPVRPSGISATEEERTAALTVQAQLISFLTDLGWSPPLIVGSSGNGGMVLYRIDLPNEAASAAVVTDVLAALDRGFSTPAVSLDRSVGNAARLVKLPGTVAAKGDHTPDRPWRRAEVVIDADTGVVTPDQLAALPVQIGDLREELVS